MFRLFNKREAYNLQNFKITKYIFFIKSSLNCTRCKSYYQVLGLNSNASSKDIKSAYYELSLKYHPDKNKGSPESVEKFREITEAYEVLGNPQKRQSYDQGKDFSSSYSQDYTTKEGYYYKPYYTKPRNQGPYTGKTKDFDYDEHFRQHYERQRMYEYEYIKRQWEAQFRRRHPDRDPEEYYRNQYKQTGRSKSREDFYKARREFYEEYKRLLAKKFRVLYFFLPFWCAFLVIPFLADVLNPDTSRPKSHHGPIYYKVKNEKHNGQNNE